MQHKVIQYICTVCGAKEIRSTAAGRPMPGTCPRARTAGRPHRWVKNKELDTGGGEKMMKNVKPERYMMVGGKKVKF